MFFETMLSVASIFEGWEEAIAEALPSTKRWIDRMRLRPSYGLTMPSRARFVLAHGPGWRATGG